MRILSPLDNNPPDDDLPLNEDNREHVNVSAFNLTTNEVRTYYNVILHIQGQINLYDFSILNISDSKIIVELDFHKQFYLEVWENATLIIDNCEFESVEWRWWNLNYWNNATVFIRDFEHTGIPWQQCDGNVNLTLINTGAGVTLYTESDCSISVSDSDFVYFEILLGTGEYDLTFPNGYVDNWEYAIGNCYAEVTNSSISRMDIDLHPGVNATVRNLEKFACGWIFGGQWLGHPTSGNNVTIDGFTNGYYADTTFYGDNAHLRLVNTTIT